MESRLAVENDLGSIMALVSQAQAFMASRGLDQWQDGYPRPEDFLNDIARGECHVFTDRGAIAAVVTVSLLPEHAYETVYGGAWLRPGRDYAVIHRALIGDAYRGTGLGRELIAHAESLARTLGRSSVRVDTHRDNVPMRRTVEACGFVYCGHVYLEGPENPRLERVIYEKVLV